jgi:hypothetical protein
MDAKRLEELAAWAKTNSDWCGRHGMTDVNANLADLARCAKAWAKVERQRRKGRWQLGIVCGCANLSSGYSGGSNTAIAAVEAAPEETP